MNKPKVTDLEWIAELKQRTEADFQLNANGRWDVDGDVDLSNYGLCKIPIPLGNVKGRLILSNNCYAAFCENFPRNITGQPGISFERCEFDGNHYLDEAKLKTEFHVMYKIAPELNVDFSDFE